MVRRFVALAVVAALLSACAATDTYSTRAGTYNTQSEDLSNEMLLLNIVRASERMPLQFTDLQSVVGSTTAGGSIGLSTPVGGFPAATPRTINPAVTGGLSTTFTAAVLSSQDFYQGVSAPISAVEASYFVRTVKPSQLIFNLLFQRLVITRGNGFCAKKEYRFDKRCEISLVNDPRNFQSTQLFQAVLSYLLRIGLTMESSKIRNQDLKLKIDKKGKEYVTDDEKKDENTRDVARYCFRPRDVPAIRAIVDQSFLCGQEHARDFYAKTQNDTDQSPVVILTRDVVMNLRDVLHGVVNDPRARPKEQDYDSSLKVVEDVLNTFEDQKVRIEFTTRSTLDVFDYLGSIVGASHRDGIQAALIPGNIAENPTVTCDLRPGDDCSPIFVLTESSADELLSVSRDGKTYAVPADRGARGYSTVTLSILKQILGLNTSSKNVPTPAVITGFPVL